MFYADFLRPIVKFFKGCGDEVPTTKTYKPLPNSWKGFGDGTKLSVGSFVKTSLFYFFFLKYVAFTHDLFKKRCTPPRIKNAMPP